VPSVDVTKLIEEAVRERLVLRVTYRALDETEMVSLIEPLAIRFNKAGHRALWCFNRDAGHLEQLLWDRIEGAAATGEVFPPRPSLVCDLNQPGSTQEGRDPAGDIALDVILQIPIEGAPAAGKRIPPAHLDPIPPCEPLHEAFQHVPAKQGSHLARTNENHNAVIARFADRERASPRRCG
jgi:hypothetical protein